MEDAAGHILAAGVLALIAKLSAHERSVWRAFGHERLSI
jgi:hypothetical protein